ncbi:MAG TPA: DUF5715 family protein [Terriglobales bacterium]|nr:DUF5715 family protein [Terriglobales bacterium]
MHAVALVVMLSLTHGNIPTIGSTHHSHLVTHHRRRHYRHVVFFNSPIRGNRESLLRQNLRVNEDDLERIQDDAQLEQLTKNGELVAIAETDSVAIDPKLPDNRRYCRPWTKSFVDDFARQYYSAFNHPLQVTSAVRTVEFQEKLRRHNGNAAPEDGEDASPHLTGATIDIAKSGMTRKQLTWTRDYLIKMQSMGLIDAEEEFRQRVFHITVYRDYEASTGPLAGTPAVKSE